MASQQGASREGVLQAYFCGPSSLTTPEGELPQSVDLEGEVERVQIMQDRETGRSCGLGFVTMPDATAAQTAGLWTEPRGVCLSALLSDEQGPVLAAKTLHIYNIIFNRGPPTM
jgi:hypothetical protein